MTTMPSKDLGQIKKGVNLMKSIQNKAYKYRIYPDKDQQRLLNQTFGCARFVWNHLVDSFNKNLEKDLHLPTLREEYPWMKDVSLGALSQKQRDFIQTKKQFFNKKRKTKIGRPQFKKKGHRDSYRLPMPKFALNTESKKIRLEKIGWVSIKLHREIPLDAELRNVTVSKTPTNKYYVSIMVKETIYHKPKTNKSVGLDLGIKAFITTSDGNSLEALKPFRENQVKLKRAQQHLSRKMKGNRKTKTAPSKKYLKQKQKVARLHEKIANQRNHFHHELSHKIISEYDTICVETLNVKGMVKNKKLSKSISDAGWSSFISQLEYKALWYGKDVVKVDRFFPSSKLCSGCGDKNDTLVLKDREWTCKACDATHDRDLNAATNILVEGQIILNRMSLSITEVERI